MDNELSDRQQAIKLRLAGRSVEEICRIVGHGPAWFHMWWRRYRALGPNGLFDLTRSNVQPRRISAELERTIVGIRQRLALQRRFILLRHVEYYYDVLGRGCLADVA